MGTLLVAALLVASCGNDDGLSSNPPPPLDATLLDTTSLAREEPLAENIAADALPRSAPRDRSEIILAEASALERNGFWEDALALRASLLGDADAASLSPALRADTQLVQLRLLIRLDDYSAAATLLAEIDSDALDDAALRSLTLLTARIAIGVGDAAAAIAAYSRYLDGGGPATTVHLLRAHLLRDTDATDAAEIEYATIIADPATFDGDLESALLNLGLLFENAERYSEAAALYDRLLVTSPWAADRAFALHRAGTVRWLLGESLAARESWLRLLRDYPWHWRASRALDELAGRALAVDPITRGIVLYRQFRSGEARTEFEQLLQFGPSDAEAAVAHFFLAALAERDGDTPAAIQGYLIAADTDPAAGIADDAIWEAARLLDGLGQFGVAATFYEHLATLYPASEFAADARFRGGLMRYRAGDATSAEAAFLSLGTELDTMVAQRGWLWAGKVRLLLDDATGARSAFQRAVGRDPFSYYGLRAQAHLAAEPRAPALSAEGLGISDPPALAATLAWLREIAGPEPEGTWAALEAGSDWRGALDLWWAGLTELADARFFTLIARHDAEPWSLFHMGQAFDALGTTHLRLQAAATMLRGRSQEQRRAAPVEILQWAYPQGWPVLAARESADQDLDPLLLYALIRQESLFNPDARSSADAWGLTQVIEPTAEEIATALGEDLQGPESLLRPERAIRYGAFYLARQLASFDGAPWIALAAYNGGPGNAYRWASEDTTIDPDLFYEQITFQETRLYVERVLQNYAWYRFIYRDAAIPSLVALGAASAE